MGGLSELNEDVGGVLMTESVCERETKREKRDSECAGVRTQARKQQAKGQQERTAEEGEREEATWGRGTRAKSKRDTMRDLLQLFQPANKAVGSVAAQEGKQIMRQGQASML